MSNNLNKDVKTLNVKCNYCGKEFETTDIWHKIHYCCKDCKKAAAKKRKGNLLNPINNKLVPFRNLDGSIEYVSSLKEKCKEKNISSYYYYNYLNKFSLKEIPLEERIQEFFLSKTFLFKVKVLEKLGFNYENKENYREEYFKVRNFLLEEYNIKRKSVDQIEKENNLGQGSLRPIYFYYFGIIKRNSSEAVKNAVLTGKLIIPLENRKCGHKDPNKNYNINLYNCFKEGYHTSWMNETFYLRSSYEFKLANLFDKNCIEYHPGERITYYDSSKQKKRSGYPDFFLPQYNLIIETKSERFYDPQNLLDRSKALKLLNIDFYVLLNKKYVLKDNFPLYKEIKYYYNNSPKKELEQKLNIIF